ncbi:MAG: hypothetical protein HY962_06735 [Ignavibacteriae bacterium]|nr:hypothetical protein [Ignavibacteriota bacterium]
MKYIHFLHYAICILGGILPTNALLCQWNSDSRLNTAVSTASHAQWIQRQGGNVFFTNTLIPRERGDGFYVSWLSHDPSGVVPGIGIYAQAMSRSGNALWSTNGIAVSDTLWNWPVDLSTTTDNRNGMFVLWHGSPISGNRDSAMLHLQRIDSAGNPRWGPSGIIAGTERAQSLYRVLSDTHGGAFVLWTAFYGVNQKHIMIQHYDSSGRAIWMNNGVVVADSAYYTYQVEMATDGNNGVYVTWITTGHPSKLMFQRIRETGAILFTTSGIQIDSLASQPRMIRADDGTNDIHLVWQKRSRLYAQRIDSAGTTKWGANIRISDSLSIDKHVITSDGHGGIYLVWSNFQVTEIRAQRISGSGDTLWGGNGVIAAVNPFSSIYRGQPQVVSDGSGGALVLFIRTRSVNDNRDLWVQRLDASGRITWPQLGRPVCTADSNQMFPLMISDGEGGAYIIWEDERQGYYNCDLYATRIDGAGLHYPVEFITFTGELVRDQILLRWMVSSSNDNAGFVVQRRAGDGEDWTGATGRPWTDIGFVRGKSDGGFGDTYSYIDDVREVPATYFQYRLVQLDYDGLRTYSPVVEIWRLGGNESATLFDPYPNPASGCIRIPFRTSSTQRVRISVQNMLGQSIEIVADREYGPGIHEQVVNLGQIPCGTYRCVLSTALGSHAKVITVDSSH